MPQERGRCKVFFSGFCWRNHRSLPTDREHLVVRRIARLSFGGKMPGSPPFRKMGIAQRWHGRPAREGPTFSQAGPGTLRLLPGALSWARRPCHLRPPFLAEGRTQDGKGDVREPKDPLTRRSSCQRTANQRIIGSLSSKDGALHGWRAPDPGPDRACRETWRCRSSAPTARSECCCGPCRE